jgi:hypothetical protein
VFDTLRFDHVIFDPGAEDYAHSRDERFAIPRASPAMTTCSSEAAPFAVRNAIPSAFNRAQSPSGENSR